MKPIDVVVGARPNFIKIAKIIHLLKRDFNVRLIHTGQHYDYVMNLRFFDQLKIPEPNFYLGVKSKIGIIKFIALIVEAYSQITKRERARLTIVVGDVTSTLAAAIASKKNNIPVAHIEAGLRSFDLSMQEELNRIITDRVSDFLFTPGSEAILNLANEGIDKNVFLVGNIMIDTLIQNFEKIEQSFILDFLKLKKDNYALLTLHRPSNVDKPERLKSLIKAINKISKIIKLVFPMHPRTNKNLKKFGLLNKISKDVLVLEPLGYFELIKLEKNSRFVITDSGGIQEETTFLKIPCLTVRNNTERPITITQGTNRLVTVENLFKAVQEIMEGKTKQGKIPKYWDGKTSERIVRIIKEKLP